MKNLLLPMTLLTMMMCVSCGIQPTPHHHPKKQDKNEDKDTPKKPEDDKTIAEFKGYEAVNQILRSRIITDGEEFTLGDFLGERHSQFEQNLTDLLGVYTGVGTANTFRNGMPNAVNMLLWYTAFSRLSAQLALQACNPEEIPEDNSGEDGDHDGDDDDSDEPLTVPLNQEMRQAMANLCAWPEASARNPKRLDELWELTARYDAPENEKAAWEEFFLGDEYADKPAATAISDMLTAVFYNPYFLLNN